jgi:urea carboxylase
MAGQLTTVEVLAAGTYSTVQDHPGRLGYWEVGVPPSGPMDERSLRIANRLVGNAEGAAALEVTLTGPRMRFAGAAIVAVTGAPLALELDGQPVPQWAPLAVPDGGVLRIGAIRGVGMRAYVAIRGGIGREPVMGSRSTFAAAGLGGQVLRKGDLLAIADDADCAPLPAAQAHGTDLRNESVLRVVVGPHGAPEFLTERGLAELLDAEWEVHHHSDRTGIRLVGPQPEWARADGGDAGLHPSNVLDAAYGVGTVMLAGDMAVVVGPDGPSLGGFAAIAQVIKADRWRLGQLRAGDRVALRPVSPRDARLAAAALDAECAALGEPRAAVPTAPPPSPRRAPADPRNGPMRCLRAGETGLLVELGPPVLELRSRVRAQMLYDALAELQPDGMRDLTPGVRSLRVDYDPSTLAFEALVDLVQRAERDLPAPEDVAIASRIVHLPLCWRDEQAMLAVERYATSVRDDAPWCPDNIEFIRRINGLDDEDAVREVVYAASYLVLGLGDVYMGAPVALPLDPRHRLVTTKYSPARTWTPANAVGIGGAFMCVYGTEGPGGYQLVGRTAQIWNATESPPWRLRHFDQIRFEPVAAEQLDRVRAASATGEWTPRIEPTTLSLVEQEEFVARHSASIAAFVERRRAAFEAERLAWAAVGGAAGE